MNKNIVALCSVATLSMSGAGPALAAGHYVNFVADAESYQYVSPGSTSPDAPGSGEGVRLVVNSSIQFFSIDTWLTRARSSGAGNAVTSAALYCGRAGERGTGPALAVIFAGAYTNSSGLIGQSRRTNSSISDPIDAVTGRSQCQSLIGMRVETVAQMAMALRQGLIFVEVTIEGPQPVILRGQLLPYLELLDGVYGF